MKCKTPTCRNQAVKGRNYCHTCYKRRWRAKQPIRAMYRALKDNATRRGKEFALTFEYFEQFCKDNNYLERKQAGEDLTIDRIEVTKGYIPGNLQVLDRAANTRKWHEEDLDELCPY